MSTFSVDVVRIRSIEPIPNADMIELAVIGDYRSVVQKGRYAAGDLAIYIPEAALIPEWLLRNLGMWDNDKNKGTLAGSDGNRVKSIKIRGMISTGILLPVDCDSPEIENTLLC